MKRKQTFWLVLVAAVLGLAAMVMLLPVHLPTQPVVSAADAGEGLTTITAITGLTANKIYDGTTTVSLDCSGAVYAGVADDDEVWVVLKTEQNFANARAETTIELNLTADMLELQGAAAEKYTLAEDLEISVVGKIAPAKMTVTVTPLTDYTYNGQAHDALIDYRAELCAGATEDDRDQIKWEFSEKLTLWQTEMVQFTAGTNRLFYRVMAPNHETYYDNLEITIAKAELTVAITDHTVLEGVVPVLDHFTVEGLVNGEQMADVVEIFSEDYVLEAARSGDCYLIDARVREEYAEFYEIVDCETGILSVLDNPELVEPDDPTQPGEGEEGDDDGDDEEDPTDPVDPDDGQDDPGKKPDDDADPEDPDDDTETDENFNSMGSNPSLYGSRELMNKGTIFLSLAVVIVGGVAVYLVVKRHQEKE